MSATELAILVAGGILLVGVIGEYAPRAIAALADWRLAGQGIPPDTDVKVLYLVAAEAIRRTDPDLPADVVERMTADVVVDLARGTLGGATFPPIPLPPATPERPR